MLKRIGVLIFTALLLLQSIDSFMAIAYYKINEKHITELFCINKSKPEMQCHGKCYLKANIIEQEDNKQNPNINFENETVEWYYLLDTLPFEKDLDKGTNLGFICLFRITNPFYFEVFRPPSSLVVSQLNTIG